MIPRSKRSTEWSLKYARKCSEIELKNSKQNFLPLHVATPWQKNARLDDVFSEVFKRGASPVEGQSLQQKDEKSRKRKGQNNNKKKSLKTQVTFLSRNFDFCSCPSRNVVKRDASGKKGMLSCYKCLLGLIEASLAHIQHENHQRSPKCAETYVSGKKLWESVG